MKKTVALIFMITHSFCLPAISQEAVDSTTRVNDILFNYGFIDYGAEYYVVDSKNSFLEHHLYFQPYVSDKNIFIIEFGVVQSFQDIGNFVSPADLLLTYQRNLKSDKYGSPGFQGIGSSLKFTIPTGRDEYLSGFNSWILEPLIGGQWLFDNTNWFSSFQLRYSYTFASLPAYTPRFDFLRIEYFIGMENSKMWLILSPDYRYIPSNQNHNLFLTLNGAIKINKDFGIKGKLTPRLAGDEFFSSQYVAGCYLYL